MTIPFERTSDRSLYIEGEMLSVRCCKLGGKLSAKARQSSSV